MLANMLLRANTSVQPFQNSPFALSDPNAYSTPKDDYFGYAVDISDNRCIVGAYGEDDGGTTSGKAYIFDVTTKALLQTLNNPNAYGTSKDDWFGAAVAISGNYCIVGAYQEDVSGSTSAGKAYVFDVVSGALIVTLNNPNPYSTPKDDYFGYSVDISGDRCIVGARGEDDAGGAMSGKAYIFDTITGALIHTLNNPNAYGTSANDYFGASVSIDGNVCIVSAYLEDDSGGTSSGKVYVFNVTTGSLLHTLSNPNAYSTSAGDSFGVNISLSGDYCVISAQSEDDVGGTSSGKAYIFNVVTGSLVQILNNPNAYSTSALDTFGVTVGLSGGYCAVGAYLEDDASGLNSGKVYLFQVTTGALFKTLNNPNIYGTSANDAFGFALAMDGPNLIIGAYYEDMASYTNVGKAYLYT